MMYAIESILRRIKAWRNHVDINEAKINHMIYRERIKRSRLMEHMNYNEFSKLIRVATYTDFGIITAIQAAFCMGYKVGKDGGGA